MRPYPQAVTRLCGQAYRQIYAFGWRLRDVLPPKLRTGLPPDAGSLELPFRPTLPIIVFFIYFIFESIRQIFRFVKTHFSSVTARRAVSFRSASPSHYGFQPQDPHTKPKESHFRKNSSVFPGGKAGKRCIFSRKTAHDTFQMIGKEVFLWHC